MELKDKLVSSYVAFENRVDTNSEVHEIRSKALKSFEELGFPTKKVRSLEIHFFKLSFKSKIIVCFQTKKTAFELADVKKYFIHDIDTYKLFLSMVNTVLFYRKLLMINIDVCLMSAALSKA